MVGLGRIREGEMSAMEVERRHHRSSKKEDRGLLCFF